MAKFDTSCQHQRVVDADRNAIWRARAKVILHRVTRGRITARQALDNFPNGDTLQMEYKDCLQNVFLGRGLIAILPIGFGNSLIFQLFPRLINALQRSTVSKIIVVTPLVAIMKDQVEQLQSIGIRALAIGVDDEEEHEEGAGKMDRLDCL